MRAGTAFLVTLALLCGLGVAADAFVTRSAEDQATARVGALLDAPADVTLQGWPVALRLLHGRVPEVRVVAQRVPTGAVVLERLDVVLADVLVDLDELERPGPLELRASRGTFVAELDEEAVGVLTGLPGAVRLGEGIGHVQIGGATVDIAVSLEEGAVVLRPIGSAPEGVEPVTVDPPQLPGSPAVDEVRITGGRLRLSGRLTRLRAVAASGVASGSPPAWF